MKDIKTNQIQYKTTRLSFLEVRKLNDLLRTTSLDIFGRTTLTKRVAPFKVNPSILY